MGKYIKSFEYHDDYLDFRISSGFSYPNVSHCINENDVHYTPLPHFVKLYDNNNMLDSLPIYNVYKEYTDSSSGSHVQTYFYDCQCDDYGFYLYTESSGDSYQSISVDFYEGIDSISSITCTNDSDSSPFTGFSFSMDGNILWIDLNNEYNGGLTFTINYTNNDGITSNFEVNVNVPKPGSDIK